MSEEYATIRLDIPKLSDFEIKAGINNVLSSSDLIKRMNELVVKDTQDKYIRELTNRIDKAIDYIKETPIGSILEVHCGEEEEYTEPLLEILKGGNDE